MLKKFTLGRNKVLIYISEKRHDTSCSYIGLHLNLNYTPVKFPDCERCFKPEWKETLETRFYGTAWTCINLQSLGWHAWFFQTTVTRNISQILLHSDLLSNSENIWLKHESFTLVRLTSLVVGKMWINGLACTANLLLSTHPPTELYVKAGNCAAKVPFSSSVWSLSERSLKGHESEWKWVRRIDMSVWIKPTMVMIKR